MKSQERTFGYGIRSTLAQCLALTTTYFFNIQQGFNVMMPTVIIGAMQLKGKDTIPDITNDQLSWIGSIVYLSPSLGSLVLSLVQAHLGHRMCMALTNVLQSLSVLIVVLFPLSVHLLYMCSLLMGLSTGFATGLCISYSGEVCEPKLRGTLTSVLNVFYFAGYFFVTTAFAITDSWKMTMIITTCMPVLNTVVVLLTPDSPIWLLSKGYTEKAKCMLKKLRGGVSEEKCAAEFQEMVKYVSKKHKSDETKQIEVSVKKRFSHPGMWRPLSLMIIYIFFSNVMSAVPYMPSLVDVFKLFDTPMKATWATSAYTAFSVIGNIFTILLVSRLGKRFLVLGSITVCSLCYLGIGIIGIFCVSNLFTNWMKAALFFLCTFSSSLGIMPIGWILVGEVFPMKSKTLGCNIVTGIYFLLSFVMTRYYKDLEDAIGFYNTFLVFGCSGMLSLIYFHINLPETENKTLQEIGEHFQKKKIITVNV